MSTSSNSGTLFVVSAPSGAGKTSLLRALLDSEDDLVLSVSHTTRPPRPGERNGVDYHFVAADEFEAMAGAGEFLEHAVVFGNRYGTGRAQVNASLERGIDVILEIDWQGARQIRQAMPESLQLFVIPPSRDALGRRLRDRGTDSGKVIEARLRAAGGEMAHFREFDYLVVNDDFDRAVSGMRAVVHAARLRRARQEARHAALIRELLADSGPIE
ncbi:MAG TPA: guanylate kinase [Gammaproteobacteria bacterium]|nr:guanylate kinase [Gammaproteobacteria bacterium]